MNLDVELYRHEVRLSDDPLIRLSAIDVFPDHAQRTFVFLHGFGGDATQWRNQLQEFSLKNRVIGLDLRGHGHSDHPQSTYSMEELLDDLESALKILKVEQKIVLVGHSFGGALASEFAARHPDRIDRLILIATAGEFKLNPIYRILLKLPYWLHRLIAPFTKNWLGAPPRVMKAWNDNNLSKWNGWDIFRDLTVPTLVLRGNRDRLFSRQYFEEVARAIPNAEDINVGASGHMVMLERSQAVNRAIKSFLSETTSQWRTHEDSEYKPHREKLISEFPWLAHYEKGVPFTISIPNIPLQHLLRSAVRRFPLRTALIYEGGHMTYRRLNQESNRFANALRSLGVDKGIHVMLLMPNLPQMVSGFFGTLKAGGVAVFTVPLHPPDEIIRQIADSGAKVLVTINQFGELASRALEETQVEHVIFSNVSEYLPLLKRIGLIFAPKKRKEFALNIEMKPEMHKMRKFLYSHSKNSPEINIKPDNLAVILYTGGTTSTAKGVKLSHRNLFANALQARHWLPRAEDVKERFICVVPFSHSYGLSAVLNLGISVGATLILKPTYEVEDTLKAIKKYKPTMFFGVPRMYLEMSKFPGVRKYGISSIHACMSGADPLSIEFQESFEKLTRGRLIEGYGLTEASGITHGNPIYGLRKIGTIGIPIVSTRAKIVSLTNPKKEVPVGQIGELAIIGPQVMLGYWHNQEATDKCLLPNGWLLTGDIAQSDSQGYTRIIARKADLWYPAKPGKPAFPRDVEEVLIEVPQVKEAAVIAIDRKPVAFVISGKQKPPVESLIAYCERKLPPELIPRRVIFLKEFPRTYVGKIIRRDLAKKYDQHQKERP